MNPEDEAIEFGKWAAFCDLKAAQATMPDGRYEWEYAASTAREMQLQALKEAAIRGTARSIVAQMMEVARERMC